MERRLIDANRFANKLKAMSESSSIKEDCRKAYHAVYLMLTLESEKYCPTAFNIDKVAEELITLHEEGYCQNEDEDDCVLDKTCSDCYRDQLYSILEKGGV